MPTIIPYPQVLERMAALNLRCQYYNSGAFAFDGAAAFDFTGWIGAEDASLRPAARAKARLVQPPVEQTLTAMTLAAWHRLLPGNIWVMPRSQWAYELDHGSKSWMPAALQASGVDVSALMGHTDSPAVEFAPAEIDRVSPLIQSLLTQLVGSDFALAFPEHPVACTLHHHKQVWWLSSLPDVVQSLSDLA